MGSVLVWSTEARRQEGMRMSERQAGRVTLMVGYGGVVCFDC